MNKGVDAADRRRRAERLYAHGAGARGQRRSAGNTVAGLAALGGRAGFIGQVARRPARRILRARHPAAGVEFVTPPATSERRPRARLILVTPDAQRTMNTFLGAAQLCAATRSTKRRSRRRESSTSKAICGTRETPRARCPGDRGGARGRAQGRLHLVRQLLRRPPPRRLQALLDGGRIDILFANEAEIAALAGVAISRSAVAAVAPQGPDPGRHAQRRGAVAVARRRARQGRRPSRSSGWSIRPAPATCSPPASCRRPRAARGSSDRCGSARSAPPK